MYKSLKKIFPLFLTIILINSCDLDFTGGGGSLIDNSTASSFGGALDDTGVSIVQDGRGNRYITGTFKDVIEIGSFRLTSKGYSDIYIAKMDRDGNFLWAEVAGGSDSDEVKSLTVDSQGNCYLIGNFYNSTKFDNNTLTSKGATDIFVAKIDSNGKWLWAQSAGGNGSDYGNSLLFDKQWNLYLCGSFDSEPISFGHIPLYPNDKSDLFVAKMDLEGNWIWAQKAGGVENDEANSIALDSKGNSFVTGEFRATANFGNTIVTSAGQADIFVAKIDSYGQWLWAKSAGGVATDTGDGITVDDQGNCYLTGKFQGANYFGTTFLKAEGGFDLFVAKIDNYGNWLWVKSAGGLYNDSGSAIVVDYSGYSYIAGTFNNSCQVGTTYLYSEGFDDVVVAKIDRDGNWQNARKGGGSNSDFAKSLVLADNGNCYITGGFSGYATFGSKFLQANGGYDTFIWEVNR